MKIYKKVNKIETKITFYLLWIFGIVMTINMLIESIKVIKEDTFYAIGTLIATIVFVYFLFYIPVCIIKKK